MNMLSIKGSLLGLAIGDALGAPLEFTNVQEVKVVNESWDAVYVRNAD